MAVVTSNLSPTRPFVTELHIQLKDRSRSLSELPDPRWQIAWSRPGNLTNLCCRAFRAAMFAALGLWGVAPYVHAWHLNAGNPFAQKVLHLDAWMGAVYLVSWETGVAMLSLPGTQWPSPCISRCSAWSAPPFAILAPCMVGAARAVSRGQPVQFACK